MNKNGNSTGPKKLSNNLNKKNSKLNNTNFFSPSNNKNVSKVGGAFIFSFFVGVELRKYNNRKRLLTIISQVFTASDGKSSHYNDIIVIINIFILVYPSIAYGKGAKGALPSPS